MAQPRRDVERFLQKFHKKNKSAPQKQVIWRIQRDGDLISDMAKCIFDLLTHQLQQYPKDDALCSKENGEWKKYSTATVQEMSEWFALGLLDMPQVVGGPRGAAVLACGAPFCDVRCDGGLGEPRLTPQPWCGGEVGSGDRRQCRLVVVDLGEGLGRERLRLVRVTAHVRDERSQERRHRAEIGQGARGSVDGRLERVLPFTIGGVVGGIQEFLRFEGTSSVDRHSRLGQKQSLGAA